MKSVLRILLSVFILTCLACKDDDNREEPCDQIDGCFDFKLIDFEPAWSPDGATIAYVHGDTLLETTGLYLINSDGTNPRILFSSASAYSPTWSPDSKWIAFSNGGHIFKIKINGDSLTQLTTEGHNFFPSWSSDGQWIVFDSDLNDPKGANVIWKMKFDGSSKTDISQHGVGEWRMPDCFRDSLKILHHRASGYSEGGPGFFLMDISGLHSVRVTYSLGFDQYPKISPNGRVILFQSQAEDGDLNLYSTGIDGQGLRKLTSSHGYFGVWSPDGSKIVYTKSSSDNGRLWIMSSDGTGKKQFTF